MRVAPRARLFTDARGASVCTLRRGLWCHGAFYMLCAWQPRSPLAGRLAQRTDAGSARAGRSRDMAQFVYTQTFQTCNMAHTTHQRPTCCLAGSWLTPAWLLRPLQRFAPHRAWRLRGHLSGVWGFGCRGMCLILTLSASFCSFQACWRFNTLQGHHSSCGSECHCLGHTARCRKTRLMTAPVSHTVHALSARWYL